MGAEAPHTPQHTPQRFGRYVLLDRMGVGGMAEVYRAIMPGAEGFRRDLVVKKILAERARAANFIEMFGHEARISALLHHPNVVQVFDFGQVDGSYFLAMELLRGRDLLAVLRSLRERQRLLPLPIAAHIAHQVALGLGYAHALTSADGQPLNIIHRDVSPSNIMCLRQGGVKLVDFGIAQALGEMESGPQESGSFKGKLGYMAPERVRNQAQDGRVDLFALGAVLWEMLTGRRLFAGKTDEEKLRRILEVPAAAPSSLRPEVPPALDLIVAKALERDPDKRYATGQELADDLEAVAAETKYHSRMLPALLDELYGSAPSAAHMALSMLTPEMLAVEPTPGGATPADPTPLASSRSGAGDRSSATPPGGTQGGTFERLGGAAWGRWKAVRGRTKVFIAVGTITGAVVLGAVARRWPSPGHPVALPAATATAAAATPSPGGAVDAPPLPSAAALTSTIAASGATAPGVTVSPAPSRPKRGYGAKRGRGTAGRIARGLSIDPFAEAAARGSAK